MKSPCIKNCKLDKKGICKGCFRKSKEIEGWKKFSKSEQKEIIEKALKRKLKKFGEDYYGFPG